MKEESKDIFKDFEKNTFFFLPSGYRILYEKGWLLQLTIAMKNNFSQDNFSFGSCQITFSHKYVSKIVLAKDLKEFECISTSVSKQKKVWQKVYSICLNRG